MKRKDYYKILGIARNADQRSIQQAFRRLARRYHPDMNREQAGSAAKFHEINEAYQTLGDANRRQRYDRELERLERPATPRPHSAPRPTTAPQNTASAPRASAKTRPPEPTGPIHSSQAHTSDIFAGATLLILIFACAIIAVGFYELTNFLSPQTVWEMSTLTPRQNMTQTARVLQTATAAALPSSTPVPANLYSTLSPSDQAAFFDPASQALSCVIDISNSRHTCNDIPQISLMNGPNASGDYKNTVLLQVDLDPRRYTHQRVRFIVQYGDTLQGLTVNIGDAKSNDGSGIDRQSRGHNAELVVDDTAFRLYGSSTNGQQGTLLAEHSNLASAGAQLIFEVSDQRLRWTNGDSVEQMLSRFLYELGGQHVEANQVDYQIHAAFNRAIRIGTTTRGTGVTHIEIQLLPQ